VVATATFGGVGDAEENPKSTAAAGQRQSIEGNAASATPKWAVEMVR